MGNSFSSIAIVRSFLPIDWIRSGLRATVDALDFNPYGVQPVEAKEFHE
jgi:hypothetical protein